MSIKAMMAVFEHSESTGGTRLVLLAIADHAHEDGDCGDRPPAVARLARKARISKRATQDAIKRLQALGELVVTYGGGREANGRGRTNRYRIVLPGLTYPAESAPLASANGEVGRGRRVKQGSPEPNTEPRSLSTQPVDAEANASQILKQVLKPGVKYPSSVCKHLGAQVKRALADGIPASKVTLAARRVMERTGRPDLLPAELARMTGVQNGPVEVAVNGARDKIDAWAARGCQHGAEAWCDRRDALCARCKRERDAILSGAH